MKYNSVLDLHTHTIVSGHAYSTLREMAKAASDKGAGAVGNLEHAPKMPEPVICFILTICGSCRENCTASSWCWGLRSIF